MKTHGNIDVTIGGYPLVTDHRPPSERTPFSCTLQVTHVDPAFEQLARDAWTMRHELVHVLLYCLTGSSDEDHLQPAFAGSSNIAAGGALARIADTASSPYECR